LSCKIVRKNERDIINEKFAETITERRDRDFLAEVQRVRRTHPNASSVVDGLSQAEDIAQVFASKFKDLYTSVSYNSTDMESLRNDLSTKLSRNGFDEHCLVSSISVSDAISQLKSGKGNGNTELTTDHFKFACPELSAYVSFLFSGLLTHLARCQGTWFLVLLYLFLKGEIVSQIRIITEVFH